MVSSLGWLCHDPSQAPDLLYQTNAVIRKLLAVGQIELAAQAAGKIPKVNVKHIGIKQLCYFMTYCCSADAAHFLEVLQPPLYV